MSRKASKTLVGVFVVAAVAIAVATVIIFGAGNVFRERDKLVAFFEGSVKGLRIGAPVTFRGVPIGQVISIKVVYNPKDLSFWIPVVLEVETDKIEAMGPYTSGVPDDQADDVLVGLGLRAQLDIQSIVTGQLYVNLDFFPDKPPHYVMPEIPELGLPYDEIPTIKTPLQEIGDAIEEFPITETLADFRRALKGIEKAINSPGLQDGIAKLGEALTNTEELVGNANSRVESVSKSVEETLAETRQLVGNLNERIDSLSANGEQTLAAFRDLIEKTERSAARAEELLVALKAEVKPVAEGIKTTLASSSGSFEQAEKTLEAAEGAVKDLGPVKHRLEKTLEEIGSAARSLRSLADYLEKHPDSLLRGKPY